MSTPSLGRVGRLGIAWWVALLSMIAIVGSAADDRRPAPLFEGKTIPNPPEQGAPWTAPASTLPKFLLDATATLFEQGVADPRGCEYRLVEFANGIVVKGRGFVLPERPGVPGRFFVAWDGLVYPAASVGEPADLDRDIRALAESLTPAPGAGRPLMHDGGVYWAFPRETRGGFNLSGVDDHSAIKLCLLLRLGRGDLAEALFAAGTGWTPRPGPGKLTNYGISYLSLATDWAKSAFSRLIESHVRGDDAIALDLARRLVKFRDLAVARADAMGFPLDDRRGRFNGVANEPASRFPFLGQLDDLLRDHERRAAMPPRGPIPERGGDPTARIAALIRDLDQIDERQMMSPGMADPGRSPLVQDLVAEGDPAVEPLLAVLESDDRLTRSVSHGRSINSVDVTVHPVVQAVYPALYGLLKSNQFELPRGYSGNSADLAGRKIMAASMRAYWLKNRSIPPVERWYRTLLDDSAGAARWLEAAGWIAHPESKPDRPPPKPGEAPLRGEPLRVGRDPSVTALMIRRIAQLRPAGSPGSYPNFALSQARSMTRELIAWDERASLPVLRDLMKESRARTDAWRARPEDTQGIRTAIEMLYEYTPIRARFGDLEALDEYADWLRTTSPQMLEYEVPRAFKPLLEHPDRPSMASAARWLFTDPKSPWVPLSVGFGASEHNPFQDHLASPIVAVAAFREGLLASLADRSPMGTVEHDRQGRLVLKRNGEPAMLTSGNIPELADMPVGQPIPYRTCDYIASKLSALEGSPPCALSWPEPRRDEAVLACVAYLKRFGDRFTAEAVPGIHDFPEPKAHLKFPILGRPATLEDVAANRAIFSLEGQGETRLVVLPGLPQLARWVTLRDTPVDWTDQNGVTGRDYDTDGIVWQAEEVRKGDRWERYYGFVGHHVIARVPASEVEFGIGRFDWGRLKGGLDARFDPIEPRSRRFEPGQPIEVTLRISNRLGVARSSPTEFLRLAPDGKPSLRRGVSLTLYYTSKRESRGGFDAHPDEPIAPRRDAHFEPGDASRTLESLAGFEAIRIIVNDWFDASKPGYYRLGVRFEGDPGVGEGIAGEAYFRVGVDDR